MHFGAPVGPALASPHWERTELQKDASGSLRKQCLQHGMDWAMMHEMGQKAGRHHQLEREKRLILTEFPCP